jgi:hypothetical protein
MATDLVISLLSFCNRKGSIGINTFVQCFEIYLSLNSLYLSQYNKKCNSSSTTFLQNGQSFGTFLVARVYIYVSNTQTEFHKIVSKFNNSYAIKILLLLQ